jgi:hypothetical protein
MTDDRMQPNASDRPEQTKPEQVGQQAQQSQASAAAQPSAQCRAASHSSAAEVCVSTWGLGADRRYPAAPTTPQTTNPQHPRLPRFCLEFPMIVSGPFVPLSIRFVKAALSSGSALSCPAIRNFRKSPTRSTTPGHT